MAVTYRMLDGDASMEQLTTGTDGLCGLDAGFTERFIYTRS